ncbi:MAG TPA: GEVED domain-containing protein [Bacteroidia bacterium]|nr:GEVED domain-containing protein [Bacteroidia bacterium]
MKKIIFVIISLIGLKTLQSQTTITLGAGSFSSGTQESSPINIWYRSHHCQILYTAAELNAAGWSGQGQITQLGFNIVSSPIYGLPNYTIKLKNTSNTDVSIDDATGLTTVYNSSLYSPTSGGFELLNLTNTHIWDGSSNLLVDVCFDQVPNYNASGEVNMFTYSGTGPEYTYVRQDASPQCSVPTNTSNPLTNPTAKPQLQLTMVSLTPCSGPPSAGFAVSSSALVCKNTPFNLSLANATIGQGISYQWQQSADGSIWNNIGNSQPGWGYSVNTISDTVYYRCITTCSISALSNTSTPVVVNLNPIMNCYCTPSSSWDCSGDKFFDFSFANLVGQSNNCDIGGYSDWSSVPSSEVNISAGNTYSFSINTSNSGIAGNAAMGVWIDYNQNAIFDANEFTSLGFGAAGSYSNTITIPITAGGTVRMRLKLDANYAYSGTTIDPCNNNNFSSYGQILDYKVNITSAPACSGIPVAGDAISSQTAVCNGTSFNLDLVNNGIVSGINYQWQLSTDGSSWNPLGAIQNTIPNSITSQSVTTYYRCELTCLNSSLTAVSNSVMISQNSPTNCYCPANTINCANGVSISDISFATMSETLTCNGNGYNDNTQSSSPIPVTAAQTYTLNTTINNSFVDPCHVGFWIDFNQNGIFEVNEYTYAGNVTNGPLSSTVSIPFTASAGYLRMRVKMEMDYNVPHDLFPCTSNASSGQTVDYLLDITPSPSCTGTPNAGDAISSKTIACASDKLTLDLTNNSQVSNAIYLWQSSTDNIAWTDLGSAQNSVPYYVSSQTSATYYRCIVECLNSSLSDTSSVIFVDENALLNCYCVPPPTICANNDVITNVLFETINNASSCGTDGYEDFTSSVPSATIAAGQTYTITTTLGNDFSQDVQAWIDYNQNGYFESNEYTYIGHSSGTGIYDISSTINIPVTATPGLTRMRIRNYTGFLTAYDPCNNPSGGLRSTQQVSGANSYGETEDYFVTILPPDCGLINFPPSISIMGNNDICLGQSTNIYFGSALPAATGITYQWKVFDGTNYVNEGAAINTPSITVTPTANTSYYCEILCNGSPALISDTIFINTHTITVAPTFTNPLCYGQCNGSIVVNATTSIGTLSYIWTPNTSTSDLATGLCSGTYTVNIANTVGCSVTETISIVDPIAISTTTASTDVSCYGLSNGSASVTVSGGTSPLSFSWSPSGGNGLVASNLAPGTYTFHIQDGNNCTLDQLITITQPSVFSTSITASSSSICEQLEDTLKSTIIGGTAPYSYDWIELPSTSVSSSADYTYTTAVGTFSYALHVTDNNNCSANSNSVAITVNPSSNISGTVSVYQNTTTPVPGYVTLYKYKPYFVQFDSITSQNIGAAGDYNFVSFTAGTYIIKATPSATNMQVAYGDTAVNWKTAKQIIHGCAVNDIQNIQVKLFPSIGSGPGSLSGIITETLGFGGRPFGSANNDGSAFKPTVPGTPIGGIVVKGGKNPGGQMFTQTLTGPMGSPNWGKYSINNLPYGDYFILVDIPGLDTNNTYHIKISPGNEVFTNLDFTVDSIQINPQFATDVSVKDINSKEHKISIFPNPANNYVTIQYSLKETSLVSVELFDILGKSVKKLLSETNQNADSYKSSWSIDDVKSGLYFIKININGIESTSKLSITK